MPKIFLPKPLDKPLKMVYAIFNMIFSYPKNVYGLYEERRKLYLKVKAYEKSFWSSWYYALWMWYHYGSVAKATAINCESRDHFDMHGV